MKNRNGTIDFLKFVFSLVIIFTHGNLTIFKDTNYIIAPSGYIAVEFFFLISGYMMCKSYEKNNNVHTISFIKSKFLRCTPNFYIAWIISFILFHIFQPSKGVIWILKDIVISIPELLLFYMGGIRWNMYMSVSWYLSSMLLAMAILYPLIKTYKNVFFDVIAPILFIVTLGILFNRYETLDIILDWCVICYGGMIRAIMGLCGGCVCYRISKYLGKFNFTRFAKILFSISEWLLYLFCILSMLLLRGSKYDFAILLLLIPAVVITVSQVSYNNILFNNNIVFWLGEYSFSIYLGHTYLRLLHEYLYPLSWNPCGRMIAYLVDSLIMGLIIMYASKLLVKLCNKRVINLIILK